MSNIDTDIAILKATRQNFLKLLEGLTEKQLISIPSNFKNHVFWNITHSVVTQQRLIYKLTNTPYYLPEDMMEAYKKGTVGVPELKEGELALVKESLFSTIDYLEKDYQEQKFGEFSTYPTSYGFELNSVEDAIRFNNVHEGLHLGYAMALKKYI